MRFLPALLVIPVAAVAIAAAQQPPPSARPAPLVPAPPTNLQVLPKDSSRQQVLQTMQEFTAALGVDCEHCHVAEDGRRDMAADAKPAKATARLMMRMTAEINQRLASGLGKPAGDITAVQCVTCHHGVAVPQQLADILMDEVDQDGTLSAIAVWRDLRARHYGAAVYDFSEAGLLPVMRRLMADEKFDDAIRFGELNLDVHPQSAATYALMGQAFARKSDRPNAIRMLEKSLELSPENAQVRRQLEALKQQ